MNFKSLVEARKKKSKLPKDLTNYSVASVIKNTPLKYLKDFVFENFNLILKNTRPYEYIHFRMFESWKTLFIRNSKMIFEMQIDFSDYEEIIRAFPELEGEVYAFMLDDIIHSEPGYELREQVNIAEDLLIPMAHMESYCGVYFPQIRKLYREIIDTATTLYDFYAVIAALEIYYDIPSEELNKIVAENITAEIELWLSEKIDIEDFESLIPFFYSSDAYDSFMKKLYDIFAVQGLDLYKFLVENVGPKVEILEHEYDCYQFHSN